MKQIILRETKSAVVAIKVSMLCHECGHAWAVKLDANGELPPNADKCLECAKRKSDKVRKAFEDLAL